MDQKTILDHLEALAQSLGLQIRYERLENETGFSTGGLCRIKDRQFVIINSSATIEEKVRTLIRVLKRFDLSGIFIRPVLRNLLEGTEDHEI